jgi:hypothetical protein
MPKVGFDGYQRGVLLRPTPRAVPPGFVRGALNLVMVGGQVRSRPGLKPAHGAAFPDPIRGGGTHYRSDGTRDYLIASGAAIYRMPLYGDPVNLTLAGLPSTEQTRVDPTAGCRFLSLSGSDNTSFIFDGVNTNLKWNGTALSKMGLPTPAVPDVPIAAGGTSIGAGTRDYYQTLRTATHESELSEARPVTQVAAGGKTFAFPVNGIDFDDPQVTRWSLYRTTNGLAERRLVATADLGVTITDNLTDLLIVDNGFAEQLVNMPPDASPRTGSHFIALAEHQSLVWGVDNLDRSIVRMSWGTSQYMAPEGWPVERTIPIAHGDGDEITALVSFHEWLVVFKQLSTWAITGGLDTDYKVVPVLAATGGKRLGIGCIAADAILHLENEIIFPSRDGFYLIERYASALQGGLSAKKVSDPIDIAYNCTNFALGAAAVYDRSKQTYMFFGHGAVLLGLVHLLLGALT